MTLLLPLLPLLACGEPTCPAGQKFDEDGLCVEDTGAAESDADTDADADADSDTDADTDADADADGECRWDSTVDLTVQGIDFIEVCAHTFEVGCTPGQSGCQYDEYPVMPVTLTHDYLVSRTEITQGQYSLMAGSLPATFDGCGADCPMETVTWHEAASFANALSRGEGLAECYACTEDGGNLNCEVAVNPYDCAGYRLLTEAEWEGAARCRGDTRYSGSESIDAVAWYSDNSDATVHPVGRKDPNACGLVDMSGNVYEMTQDLDDDDYYTSEGRTDPTGGSSGEGRIGRGGAWLYGPEMARVSARAAFSPGDPREYVGFRLGRVVQ